MLQKIISLVAIASVSTAGVVVPLAISQTGQHADKTNHSVKPVKMGIVTKANRANEFYVNGLKTAINYELQSRGYNEISYLTPGAVYNLKTKIIDPAISYAIAAVKHAPKGYNPGDFSKVAFSFASSDSNIYQISNSVLTVKVTVNQTAVFFNANKGAYLTIKLAYGQAKSTLVTPYINKKALTAYTHAGGTVNGVNTTNIKGGNALGYYGSARITQFGEASVFIGTDHGVTQFNITNQGINFHDAVANFRIKQLKANEEVVNVYQLNYTANKTANKVLLLLTSQGRFFSVSRTNPEGFLNSDFANAQVTTFGGHTPLPVQTLKVSGGTYNAVNKTVTWNAYLASTTGSLYTSTISTSTVKGGATNILNVKRLALPEVMNGVVVNGFSGTAFTPNKTYLATSKGLVIYDGLLFKGNAFAPINAKGFTVYTGKQLGIAAKSVTDINVFWYSHATSELIYLSTPAGVFQFNLDTHKIVAGGSLAMNQNQNVFSNNFQNVFGIPFTNNGKNYFTFYGTIGISNSQQGGIIAVDQPIFL